MAFNSKFDDFTEKSSKKVRPFEKTVCFAVSPPTRTNLKSSVFTCFASFLLRCLHFFNPSKKQQRSEFKALFVSFISLKIHTVTADPF